MEGAFGWAPGMRTLVARMKVFRAGSGQQQLDCSQHHLCALWRWKHFLMLPGMVAGEGRPGTVRGVRTYQGARDDELIRKLLFLGQENAGC